MQNQKAQIFFPQNFEITLSEELSLAKKKFYIYIFLIGIHSKAEQPLRGMELQEKEAQKDYSIQEIYLEKTYT